MISIVIPVYNVEKYIKETIRSILAQTFKDYEIILVDDGGTDKSVDEAKEVFEKEGFHNFTIVSEINSGQGVARNKGMEMAKGEWVFFMDADDIIHPRSLEILMSESKKRVCEVVFCGFTFSSENPYSEFSNNYPINTYSKTDLQYAYLTRKKKLLVPGTLYKKSFLLESGLEFPGIRYSEDSFFLWKMLEKVESAVEVDCPLYIYIVRDDSTMVAPKINKVLGGYKAFCDLSDTFQNSNDIIPEVKKWMLSRWVLGVMRACAGNLGWEQYRRFSKELSFNDHCNNLKGFPDKRVQMMRLLSIANLKLFYTLAAKVNPYKK